jgi:hypothetical protein
MKRGGGWGLPLLSKLEGEVTSLSESSQGEVGDNRERSEETSGRSQLRLIETLFRDPSDITCPNLVNS